MDGNTLTLAGPTMIIFILVMVWSAVWKAIAMWKSARNKQMPWFVFFAVVNLVGIPEILYLRFWQRDKNHETEWPTVPVKQVAAKKKKTKPAKKKARKK